MNSFWNYILWGNTIRDWAIAIAIILGAFIILRIVKEIVVIQLKNWAKKTEATIDDFLIHAIEKHILPVFYLLSIYFGLSYLSFNTKTQQVIKIAMLVAGTFFIIRFITSLIGYMVSSYIGKQQDADVKRKQARGIIIIINVIVWIVGIIFLIDNLGYDITTLVAGLGIGGVAIALAAQVVLKDLFSYFVIFFDKPFEIGDFIIVDDKLGSVEYIGIKTTRIRALSGEQLVMSNTDLTDSRVQNYKRMEQRRVVFSLRVAYQTPSEKLKKIPGMVKDIILSQNLVKFDRAHFSSIGDSNLNFEFVYYVLSADYNVYMDIQQAINLAIMESFEKEHIEFAYPAQRIYLEKEDNSEKPEKESSSR